MKGEAVSTMREPAHRNPFIQEGSREATQRSVEVVLHMLEVYMWGLGEIQDHSYIGDPSHLEGVGKVIAGVREAVEWLSLTEQRDNVAQLIAAD